MLASVNSSGSGDRTASWPQLQLGTNLFGGTPLYWTEQLGTNSARVRGLAERSSGPWDNRSGEIANGTGEYWYFGVEVYVPDSTTAGGASSAFGYTVAGVGANEPQNITNFGTQSVTPGQTYTIVVGGPDNISGGQSGGVSFQFYQS